MIDWMLAHGYWLGAGLAAVVLFLVIWQIVGLLQDRYDHDDFEPIGEDVPPPPRRSPFRDP